MHWKSYVRSNSNELEVDHNHHGLSLCRQLYSRRSGSSTGFLADKATVQKWSDESTDLDKNLHNYEVRAASGPQAVIYANGQWLNLEQENSELIANLLRHSSKKKALLRYGQWNARGANHSREDSGSSNTLNPAGLGLLSGYICRPQVPQIHKFAL